MRKWDHLLGIQVLGKRSLLGAFWGRSQWTSGRQAERRSWGWEEGPWRTRERRGNALLSHLPVGMDQLIPGAPSRMDPA